MLKKILLLSLVCFLLFYLGCSEDDTPEPADTNPRNLAYVTYADSVKLTWSHCEASSENDFMGYFIFVENHSIVSDDTSELPDPYNGTAELGTEMMVDGLVLGSKYFFHVRAAFGTAGDYTLGDPSNEVETAPVIVGYDTLYEFASAANPSGYYFEGGHPVNMISEYAESIDIYLDTLNNRRAFKSPHLVPTEHPELWEERVSEVLLLGEGSFNNFNVFRDANWDGDNYEVEITVSSQVFTIKTPNNHYVKLIIVSTFNEAPNRAIGFRYAYQPIVGYQKF
ncbi:fibronectin type III domain-containing protein [bacterium]|nr:fibronectin type III domain-containing protein [bacterium]